jgi:hypothetical protein
MNSTYIHLRAKGSYIYMYRREKIYKEPLKNYNNKNTNTYLIVTRYVTYETSCKGAYTTIFPTTFQK